MINKAKRASCVGYPFCLRLTCYHKKQLGGPDGELAASMRYLHQRYSMPYKEVVGILTDVGTEDSEMFSGGQIMLLDAFATV